MLFCESMKRSLDRISLGIGGDDMIINMLDELWVLDLETRRMIRSGSRLV